MSLKPPLTEPEGLPDALRAEGQAVIAPEGLATLVGVRPDALDALAPYWDDLPPDEYLRDGGRYRRRRHGCFVVDGKAVQAVARRAHWQPVEYNALHGGLERWFEPIDPGLVAHPAWTGLVRALADTCSQVRGTRRWHVEAHQFRIDTTDGIGRPTPEGAHRDGVDFVSVILVARGGVKGGETRVFDAGGPCGIRFTLAEAWTMLMLDDARVIHETTPIQPLHEAGHRDTLVLTFRAEGFQGPPADRGS